MSLTIAVVTLCRDRLDYSKHCFARLHEFAGCTFAHFVLDQGSTDGSADWLQHEYDHEFLIRHPENIGICRGLNELLDCAFEIDDYDVIVKFDNDCELTQPDTLKDVAQLANDGGCILSPRILGLRNPPQPVGELTFRDELILDVPQIGGIFMAVPAWAYNEFRYTESGTVHGNDDVELCWWWRRQGGTCGYVNRFEAWHYRGTDGQHEDYGWYFDRRVAEGGRP